MCQQSDDDRGSSGEKKRGPGKASPLGRAAPSCWLSSLRDFSSFPPPSHSIGKAIAPYILSFPASWPCSLYGSTLSSSPSILFFFLSPFFSILLFFILPLSTLFFRTQREIHRLFRIRPSIIIRRRVNTQTHTAIDCMYTPDSIR